MNIKSILAAGIAAALSTASFAGAYADLPSEPLLPTNSVDCGASSTCMPDQTLNQGDNTSTKTAQQDLNGNAVTISPVLTDENINKNNITGGNTTSTGGTNTATGGTYTTGALSGGSVGDLSTGASTASNGSNSNGAQTMGSQSNGANSNGAQTNDLSKKGSDNVVAGNLKDVGNASVSATDNSSQTVQGKQKQDQKQQSAQSMNESGNSKSASGIKDAGNSKNDNKSGVKDAGNANVDTRDQSTTTYKSLALALPVIPTAAPTVMGVGQISTTVGSCGPLQGVAREEVMGTYQGLIFKTKVKQGYDERLKTFTNANGEPEYFKEIVDANGNVLLIGSQPVISTSVIALGGARNIGANGGGQGGGSYGAAGLGSSAQTQQLATTINVQSCVYSASKLQAVYNIKQ